MATSDIIMEAAQRIMAGEKIGAVLSDTGLKYSPVWLTARWLELTAEAPELFLAEPTAAVAVKLREEEGCSWGEIAVRFSQAAPRSFPESRVRAWFKQASGVRSEGLRIGKGGRWFAGEEEFYMDVLRKPGTQIPADMPIAIAREVATKVDRDTITQGLLSLQVKELKALMADHGIKFKVGMTKAQMIRAIRSAQKATV